MGIVLRVARLEGMSELQSSLPVALRRPPRSGAEARPIATGDLGQDAITTFGEAAHWRDAGWLTPAGRWVDFARGGSDRGESHHAIRLAMVDDPRNANPDVDDDEINIAAMNAGLARISPDQSDGLRSLTIQVTRPLTAAQRRAIVQVAGGVDAFYIEAVSPSFAAYNRGEGSRFHGQTAAASTVTVGRLLRGASEAAAVQPGRDALDAATLGRP